MSTDQPVAEATSTPPEKPADAGSDKPKKTTRKPPAARLPVGPVALAVLMLVGAGAILVVKLLGVVGGLALVAVAVVLVAGWLVWSRLRRRSGRRPGRGRSGGAGGGRWPGLRGSRRSASTRSPGPGISATRSGGTGRPGRLGRLLNRARGRSTGGSSSGPRASGGPGRSGRLRGLVARARGRKATGGSSGAGSPSGPRSSKRLFGGRGRKAAGASGSSGGSSSPRSVRSRWPFGKGRGKSTGSSGGSSKTPTSSGTGSSTPKKLGRWWKKTVAGPVPKGYPKAPTSTDPKTTTSDPKKATGSTPADKPKPSPRPAGGDQANQKTPATTTGTKPTTDKPARAKPARAEGKNSMGQHSYNLTDGASLYAFGEGLKNVPASLEEMRQQYEAMAAAAEDEQPIDNAVSEGLREIASFLRAAEDLAGELHPRFRQQHEADIERVENPRKGSHAVESRADVQSAQRDM